MFMSLTRATTESKFSQFGRTDMRVLCTKLGLRIAVPGAVLSGLGGCLGPNPGFFISSSVANASISTLVNAFLSNALGLGGG